MCSAFATVSSMAHHIAPPSRNQSKACADMARDCQVSVLLASCVLDLDILGECLEARATLWDHSDRDVASLTGIDVAHRARLALVGSGDDFAEGTILQLHAGLLKPVLRGLVVRHF